MRRVLHHIFKDLPLMHAYSLRSCYTRRLVAVTCPRNKITYMSHEATCPYDMSPIFFLRVCSHKECAWLVYLKSCRSNMSQVHVTRGDGMCVWHFVTATCCMNSNWFEFMWQVAATSHGIKLYQNMYVTRGDLLQGRVMATGHLVWQDLSYCLALCL